MDIETARRKKRETEVLLTDAIEAFEKETGLVVTGMKRDFYTALDAECGALFKQSGRIKLEVQLQAGCEL